MESVLTLKSVGTRKISCVLVGSQRVIALPIAITKQATSQLLKSQLTKRENIVNISRKSGVRTDFSGRGLAVPDPHGILHLGHETITTSHRMQIRQHALEHHM